MNFTPIPTPQQAAFQDWAFGLFFRRIGWIKEGDLKLS